jgi:hypothetical protein
MKIAELSWLNGFVFDGWEVSMVKNMIKFILTRRGLVWMEAQSTLARPSWG